MTTCQTMEISLSYNIFSPLYSMNLHKGPKNPSRSLFAQPTVCVECTYHYFLQNGNHGEEKQPQKNQLAREMKQLDDMATFKQFLSAL